MWNCSFDMSGRGGEGAGGVGLRTGCRVTSTEHHNGTLPPGSTFFPDSHFPAGNEDSRPENPTFKFNKRTRTPYNWLADVVVALAALCFFFVFFYRRLQKEMRRRAPLLVTAWGGRGLFDFVLRFIVPPTDIRVTN